MNGRPLNSVPQASVPPVITGADRPSEHLVIEPEPMEGAEALKEKISTWLSVLAMLSISIGVGWGLWVHGFGSGAGGGWGPYALIPAGVTLATILGMADTARKPTAVTVDAPKPMPSMPGPTDPGNLHVKGPGSRS